MLAGWQCNISMVQKHLSQELCWATTLLGLKIGSRWSRMWAEQFWDGKFRSTQAWGQGLSRSLSYWYFCIDKANFQAGDELWLYTGWRLCFRVWWEGTFAHIAFAKFGLNDLLGSQCISARDGNRIQVSWLSFWCLVPRTTLPPSAISFAALFEFFICLGALCYRLMSPRKGMQWASNSLFKKKPYTPQCSSFSMAFCPFTTQCYIRQALITL